MEKVRFGIIGCGTIAKRFAKALQKSPCADLVSCASRDLSRAQAFAGEQSGDVPVRAYGDYQALLDDPEVQAVYIATVNSTHAEIARMAIRAKKAVICEKPFFTNAQEAEKTIALAREHHVLIMEGFWTRTVPAYLKALEWVRSGRIGDITQIRAAFCFNIPYNEQTKTNRLFDPETGGGAFYDVGVYTYEYVTGIMGCEPEEVRTLAVPEPTGVDALTAIIMRFQNGAIGDCLCAINGYMDDTAIISGTRGYIKQHRFWGSRKAELFTSSSPEPEEVFEDDETEGFVHEIRHFCELYSAGETESGLIPLEDSLNFARRADEVLKALSSPLDP